MGKGQQIGQSGDGGIDGYIQEDKLGLDMIYIQAKRWNRENSVSRPAVQAFVGSLMGAGATKGVFITTSSFSKQAEDYAKSLSNLKVHTVRWRFKTSSYSRRCARCASAPASTKGTQKQYLQRWRENVQFIGQARVKPGV